VFEDRVHLRFVPRGEAEPLAEVLAELLASPERRARLGEAGRARALELGTTQAVGAQFARALEGLAA
jgi:hypothetical protein